MVWREDIGLWCIDRAEKTCIHATNFCKWFCYRNNFTDVYDLTKRDARLEPYWSDLNGFKLKTELDRKTTRKTDRVRMASLGESIFKIADIYKIKDFALANPDRLIWVPTRAWSKKRYKTILEKELMPLDNVRLFASLDPDHTQEQKDTLSNWSTMFFGDDSELEFKVKRKTRKRIKCPKTWNKESGIKCNTCTGGCFESSQIDIHLKNHSKRRLKK